MKLHEIDNLLVESITTLSKEEVKAVLDKAGLENTLNGNKFTVLIEIPKGGESGAQRKQVMQDLLNTMKLTFPKNGVFHDMSRTLGSVGGVGFTSSPIRIMVKDKKTTGGGSSGKLNEENLRSMLQLLIMEYKTINVTFIDRHGKKLTIKNCSEVMDASVDVGKPDERKKADIVLTSDSGSLPVSLKQLNAAQWESADSSFGEKARGILQKLQKDKVIKLNKHINGDDIYYSLPKEIVIEPTLEETMNAIFGTDLLNKGGVVIQTFKDEHFKIEEDEVTIQCEHVIKSKADIPEAHLMVWLIRNAKARNNPLPGLRTVGVTLTRGIGESGLKDVILVDQHGKVIEKSNKDNIQPKKEKAQDLKKDVTRTLRKHSGVTDTEPDLGRTKRKR